MGNSPQSKVIQSIIPNKDTTNSHTVNDSFQTKDQNQNSTGIQNTRFNESNSPSDLSSLSNKTTSRTKREKKHVILSSDPKQQQYQIQRAKQQYEIKKSENVQKMAEINQKRETYKKIYGDYNLVGNKYKNEDTNNDEQVIIWGNRVIFESKDPMNLYYMHKYPKQPLIYDKEQQEYSNWEIYKKQINNQKLQQLSQQEQDVMEEEKQLKERYQSLIKQKEYKKKQSRIQGYKNNEFFKLLENSGQLGEILGGNLQNIITPSFKNSQKLLWDPEKIQNPEKEQYGFDDDNEASPIYNNTDPNFSSFLLNLISTEEQNNPQNLSSQQQSEADFLAKQIFYYQMYLLKRKSSYVPSQSPLNSFHAKQYPSRRQFQSKPTRTVETIIEPYRKQEKSTKKKSKKSKSRSRINPQQISKDSQYTKIYQKIPINQKPITNSSQSDKLNKFQSHYPWERSPFSKKEQTNNFPNKMLVNDSLDNTYVQQNEVLQFYLPSRQGSYNIRKDFVQRKNSNLSIPEDKFEMTEEERQEIRYKRYQRNLEARILQRVRSKHL